MDNNKKEFQGWIYYIKNKVNGKMYVGKTNNFRRRYREHFRSSFESCPKLQRAFIKYGKENFEMVSIVTFRAISVKVLNKVLNTLEIIYIKKFDSFNTGYNTTLGGEGLWGHTFTKEHRQNLSKAMKGKAVAESTKEILRQYALKQDHSWKNKPILQYSLDGIFIREFISAKVASETLGLEGGIWSSLHDPKTHDYNYLWRFKTSEDFPIFIEPYKHSCAKTVYHYSKEHILLGTYNSPAQAFRKTGIKVQTIIASAHIEHKNSRKDYWSYRKEVAMLLPFI